MISADTSIFVYLWDERDALKRAVAEDIVRGLTSVPSAIGLQSVGEVQNVLRRKFRLPVWEAAQRARNLLAAFEVFSASRANAEESLGLMAAGRFAYWDALLVTAARDAGCTVLFSEDMDDGMRLGPLEIVNPFGVDGMSDRARLLLEAAA